MQLLSGDEPRGGCSRRPNKPKQNQMRPNKSKQNSLDLFGFIRSNRGFSMGYEQSK
jgi:hypothetical protein